MTAWSRPGRNCPAILHSSLDTMTLCTESVRENSSAMNFNNSSRTCVANMPQAMTPQMPHPQCTGIASTTSSIWIRSSSRTEPSEGRPDTTS